MQTINMGSVQLRFLQDKDDTEGSLDLFELTLQPNARMPVPHYHETWDETVYGLVGVSTWTVDGGPVEVGPGQSLFIRRRAVHGFTNNTDAAVTCLCILSWDVVTSKRLRACWLRGLPIQAR
jgi:quercetin dioxygenase-like cupin family protein